MKPLKIKFYSDPGHGWFAVKRKLLDQLGIANRISGFSYTLGATVYCEEDCDGSLLISSLKGAGIPYAVEEKNTNKASPIRTYMRYIP